jgi:hypothetical protein
MRLERWVAVLVAGLAALPRPGLAGAHAVLLPSDLGATVIDVADYPAEHQRTYRELFLPKCGFCHTTARAVNAAFLEVSPSHLAKYRATDPPTESPDGIMASPTIWKDYVTRMWHRPPCCNRCPVFTRAEAIRLWQFLAYDSLRRKTGPRAAAWKHHRQLLLNLYAKRNGGPDDHVHRPADPQPDTRVAGAGGDTAGTRRDDGRP